ncbi:DUF3071 domain-containing protein [Leucobacter insecticola]|uniref:DUF3071 domain-containing protein n=1 Tax=Leucobacter insecticola TaxID=2714934 RepID=A0A6G8FJV7_9MICO|nr:septation protein SepH [Leucobacter insecticola]QIM16569.1 DUF3071 domain-containing protein [Leucobacter insecticola]
MDELRFVRREDLALIVANEADEEFRLIVDDAVLSELRHLSKRDRDALRVKPREIQALIRAGKSRAEVAELTELDEADIERYEEPVLAERRYILELAQDVPVRTEASGDADQRFGTVISERLIGLGSEASEWSSWRDEESGWMISLDFVAHDVAHRAVWAFAHRKGTLSPINPDAVTLSKQGEVGDRLIPKLRAVDSTEKVNRFDSGAFDHTELALDPASAPTSAARPAVDDASVESSAELRDHEEAPDTLAPSLADPNAEYERRREIDQRAIKTDDLQQVDLSQTADLLDALRKRRGEREQHARSSEASTHPAGAGDPENASDQATPNAPAVREVPDGSGAAGDQAAPRSIWGASGVTGGARPGNSPTIAPVPAAAAVPKDDTEPATKPEQSTGRKGRASIPSWDDILFGTRSDEDPA